MVEIEDDVGFEMINDYFEQVPYSFYEGAVSILFACLVIFIALKGVKIGLRYTATVVLIEYSALLYGSTVFFRNTQIERKYDIHPFWTYVAIIMDGQDQFVIEIIMNIIAFMPVGLLAGCAFRSMTWLRALSIGCLLSIGIEVLQFFYMKGFSEVDDVIHNTIGCLIGYGIYKMFELTYRYAK